VRYEVQAVRKDGTEVLFEASIKAIDYEGGPAVCAIIRDITERKRAEEALQQQAHDLSERVKELNCLYDTSTLIGKQDISSEELLQGTLDLIPPAWQYPEITCARIILEDQEFRTENFRDTIWKQTQDINLHDERIGTLEVCYLEERPESDDGPFLKEERGLIEAIAARVGETIERKRAEDEIRKRSKQLEALHAIAATVSRTLDLQQLLDGALAKVLEVMDVEAGGIYLLDIPAMELTLQAHTGISDDFFGEAGKIKLDEHELERAVQWRDPTVRMEGTFNEATLAVVMGAVAREGFKMLTIVPLRAKRVAHGVLCIASRSPHNVTPEDIELLHAIGNQIAVAVQNAELLLQTEARAEALKESEEKFRGLVNGMTDAYIVLRGGRIVFANQRCAEVLGVPIDHFLGQPFPKFLAPESLPLAIELYERSMRGESLTGEMHEFTLLLENGFRIRVEISYQDIIYDGKPAVSHIIRDITERKMAEQALRDSEEMSRGIVESAATGIYIVQDEKFQYVSPQIEHISGYTSDELIGTDSLMYVHPEDREAARNGAIENLKGLTISPHEFRFVRKDGQPVWILEKVASIQYLGEQAAVGTLLDITENKRAEEALRESEAKYRILVDSAPDAIVLVDLEGRIISCNSATEVFTGYDAEELQGKSFLELSTLEPEDLPRVTKFFEDIMLGRDVEDFEMKSTRKDGSERWMGVKVRILKSEETITGILVIGRDITEHKLAEEALRASEEKYRELIENINDAYAVVRRDKLVFLNQRCADIFGYPREELVGQSFFNILAPEAVEQNMRILGASLSGGTIPERYETVLLRMDGTPIDAEIGLRPITFEGKSAYSVIARDITERKRAEEALQQRTEELEHSNWELEQFAYVASHDLQEPLRMVASYVQLLQRRYKDKLDADAEEFIGYAVDGASRMQRMINDLLAYSRVGTRGKDFAPTDCEAVLSQTLTNLEVAIGESDAVVTHDSLPSIMADDMQLGQLFQNLIGNAIKFRDDEPPRVHVSAEQKGNEWVFSIRDNGIGIAPEFTDRIFDIFQRLHSKNEYPGTGIGLAICRRIVERHGGQIWVESQPKKGSSFYFTIPTMGDGQP